MYLQGASGSVVNYQTLEREVSGSKPTAAMFVLEQDMLPGIFLGRLWGQIWAPIPKAKMRCFSQIWDKKSQFFFFFFFFF